VTWVISPPPPPPAVVILVSVVQADSSLITETGGQGFRAGGIGIGEGVENPSPPFPELPLRIRKRVAKVGRQFFNWSANSKSANIAVANPQLNCLLCPPAKRKSASFCMITP
jgi:hypothetical protein